MPLPTVIASSVIRSAHQGDSHGGVCLVDLETGSSRQVVDWNTVNIDWEGRGADRGLRGIAFHKGMTYIAASDEVFVFDREFRIARSFKNPFLRHCHEICIAQDKLYLTSTGFDSILEHDLKTGRFTRGYTLRATQVPGGPTRVDGGLFDPESGVGPAAGDTVHINNVFVDGGVIFFSALRLTSVFSITAGKPGVYATIPRGTHNARPFRWKNQDGVLANCTENNVVRFMDRQGKAVREFAIPTYDEGALLNAHLPKDHARQGFGRGLCVLEGGRFAAGSSPSTICVHDLESGETIKRINLTMDVRNAVHGLMVWPF